MLHRLQRVAFVTVIAVAACASACTLLTSLDGLSDGPVDAAAADGAGDTSSSGEGGADAGDAGDAADSGDSGISREGCPTGRGPLPVRIDLPAGFFCVDSTEVTRAQYDQFLSSSPSNTHPRCGFNTSFIPTRFWPYPAARAAHPVLGVDWCDAYAFCQWSGKELCGAITRGPIATASARDTKTSILPRTCSREGTRSFPYGNTFDDKACNGQGLGGGESRPVGTTPTCEGGYVGVFDLSGNAAEWIDACDNSPDGGGADDACRSFNSGYTEVMGLDLTCTTMRTQVRSNADSLTGFRCCAVP